MALSGLEAFPFDDVVVVSGGPVVSPGGEQRVSNDLEKADLRRYCQELRHKAKAIVLYGEGGEIIRSILESEANADLQFYGSIAPPGAVPFSVDITRRMMAQSARS